MQTRGVPGMFFMLEYLLGLWYTKREKTLSSDVLWSTGAFVSASPHDSATSVSSVNNSKYSKGITNVQNKLHVPELATSWIPLEMCEVTKQG
jgi:hypothetical protein